MKKKIIWGIIVGIILVSFLGWFIFNQGTTVSVTLVKRGDIIQFTEDTGTVKSKDSQTVSIEGIGLIQSLPVDVGQKVKKGELLLSMDKSQLEIQLKQADAKIKEAEANAGGNEMQVYSIGIEKAKISVDQAQVAYSLALSDYNNAKALNEAGAFSYDELNRMEAALKNAKAQLDAAQVDLQKAQTDTPEYILDLENAQLEQAILNKAYIELSLKKQDVLSPMDGVVLKKNVDVNMMGVPGTEAFVIGNTENMEVEIDILSDDAANIKLGAEVEITERSERKQMFKGKVAKIAPSAEKVTSSLGINQQKVPVTISLMEETKLLKPGYEVDVKVITQRKSNVIIVPINSVFDYLGKSSVLAVESGKAALKTVQKGIQGESFVEIVAGLKEGEIVLSEPDIDVREGMKIKLPENVE